MAGLTEGVATSKRGLALLLEQVCTEKTARAALRERRAARERSRSMFQQAELGHHGRYGSRAAQALTGFEAAACHSRRGRHAGKQCGRLVSSRVALRNEVACRVSPTSLEASISNFCAPLRSTASSALLGASNGNDSTLEVDSSMAAYSCARSTGRRGVG